MKRFWKVGVLALALLAMGGVAVGIVAAQSGGTSTPSASNATPGQKQQLVNDFLDKLATNLGISTDTLKSALTKTDTQMLDQAVADGKITQAEADKIKAKIESGNGPIFPFLGRGHGGRGFLERDNIVQQTAAFLGIDRQAVVDALKNNQSLAQVAQDHGKTADELSGYLYDQLKSKLDQAVTNNKITQDKENTVLSSARDRINTVINKTGFGRWGKGGMETPGAATPSNGATPNPTSL
jgi:uncharacterized protein YidB (DUF937 family)